MMSKPTTIKYIIDTVEPYDGHYRMVWKHTFDCYSEALHTFDLLESNRNCIAATLIKWESDVKNAPLNTGDFNERSNENLPIQKIIKHGSRTYIKKDGKDFSTMDDWLAYPVDSEKFHVNLDVSTSAGFGYLTGPKRYITADGRVIFP
jgi:hypothetical protein